MNRIILIGNGFDLAHGLKTSYKDFITDYWEQIATQFQKAYEDKTLLNESDGTYKFSNKDITINKLSYYSNINFDNTSGKKGYDKIIDFLNKFHQPRKNELKYTNQFLGQITNKIINNWVDIELEYYLALNQCLTGEPGYRIEQLNNEFSLIKNGLQEYLKKQNTGNITRSTVIAGNIYPEIMHRSIPEGQNQISINHTLFLNFNYTNTQNMYFLGKNSDMLIHIHGELGNNENPIIFGFGDEIDEKYKLIEQKNDNRYLENIKSMKYSETRNYQNLLSFINSEIFQIFIMGHSCGVSDRTLLNTLFEHKNCVSIKIFYHKIDITTDNYNDVYKNISRNFTSKPLMREKVVNKLDCVPLS